MLKRCFSRRHISICERRMTLCRYIPCRHVMTLSRCESHRGKRYFTLQSSPTVWRLLMSWQRISGLADCCIGSPACLQDCCSCCQACCLYFFLFFSLLYVDVIVLLWSTMSLFLVVFGRISCINASPVRQRWSGCQGNKYGRKRSVRWVQGKRWEGCCWHRKWNVEMVHVSWL